MPEMLPDNMRPENPCCSKRYTVAVLMGLGFTISFGMRCNMTFAKMYGVELNWTKSEESAEESSFFWGYLVTQFPGGILASIYPANRIFGIAVAISSFLNLLLPAAMESSLTVSITISICQGLAQGVMIPACHGIWRFWAPPLERSRLPTLAFCGMYIAILLGMPLSGYLYFFNWRTSFFFYGIVGLVWYLVWLRLSFEKPANDPTITTRELLDIDRSQRTSTLATMRTVPWRSIFTSMPVYAIIVANFCLSWNFYFLVLYQTAFLRQMFKSDEELMFAILRYLLPAVIVPAGGLLADKMRKRGYLTTTTNVRKVFICGGFGMVALSFVVIAYAQSVVMTVAMFAMGVFSGFALSGFFVNHLDIAPRYASILMGLSNGIGTFAGILCPIAIDNIIRVRDAKDRPWKMVFPLMAAVHLFGATFYALFASGELQPWAEPMPSEEESPRNALEDASGADAPMQPQPPPGTPTAEVKNPPAHPRLPILPSGTLSAPFSGIPDAPVSYP